MPITPLSETYLLKNIPNQRFPTKLDAVDQLLLNGVSQRAVRGCGGWGEEGRGVGAGVRVRGARGARRAGG